MKLFTVKGEWDRSFQYLFGDRKGRGHFSARTNNIVPGHASVISPRKPYSAAVLFIKSTYEYYHYHYKLTWPLSLSLLL